MWCLHENFGREHSIVVSAKLYSFFGSMGPWYVSTTAGVLRDFCRSEVRHEETLGHLTCVVFVQVDGSLRAGVVCSNTLIA